MSMGLRRAGPLYAKRLHAVPKTSLKYSTASRFSSTNASESGTSVPGFRPKSAVRRPTTAMTLRVIGTVFKHRTFAAFNQISSAFSNCGLWGQREKQPFYCGTNLHLHLHFGFPIAFHSAMVLTLLARASHSWQWVPDLVSPSTHL